VDVDQHAPLDRREETRAPDLVRLKDHVPIRQDDRGAAAAQVPDHLERSRVEPVGEGVIDQERGQREEVGIARVLEAVALERSQVIGVAQLPAQILEQSPVALLPLRADLLVQELLEVLGDPVVVEERVVDVEEEDDARAQVSRPGSWPRARRPGPCLRVPTGSPR
jgi:hypothetical protein